MTSPTAPTPPTTPPATPPTLGQAVPPAGSPFDIFPWLSERDPTWTSWTVGLIIGILCVAFGARGVYAYWRGEPPDKEKGIPTLPLALGLLVFGLWVLWVFGVSRVPS